MTTSTTTERPSRFKELSFQKGTIDASSASVQLDHKNAYSHSLLYSCSKRKLFLCGALQIITPDGHMISGKAVLSLLKDGICTNQELKEFIEGQPVASLSGYIVALKPRFQWYRAVGVSLSTPFTVLSDDMDVELYDLEQCLLEESKS